MLRRSLAGLSLGPSACAAQTGRSGADSPGYGDALDRLGGAGAGLDAVTLADPLSAHRARFDAMAAIKAITAHPAVAVS